MTSKKMDSGSKDFINNLPDSLVCHILSFLTTRDAALTSVLSRKWRYLLAFVPNLVLDNTFYDQPKMGRKRRIYLRKSFKLFLDRVMALQGNDAPLNKFSLKFKFGSDPSRVNGWVLKALDRGVAELDLFITSEYDYPLPQKVFMSKTLVRLKVAGIDEFVVDVGEVSLPKLKSLHFNVVSFKDETGAAFAKLISACPVLEELVMIKTSWDYWESCVVSNASLKRVTICLETTDGHENPKSVVFDTPSLVRLEYTDTVAVKYLVNFDSLVEASIGIQMTPDQVFTRRDLVNRHYGYKLLKKVNAADFLKGISNVKILYLTSQALQVLTFCCKPEAIPVFNNLIHLTVETDEDVDWESLPKLLKNCPNLETLVFEELHYGDTNQCFDEGYRFKDTNKCFELPGRDRCECKPWDGVPIWLSTSPVKTLKVLDFGATYHKDDFDRQVDLIKHFVETMPNLEQVILYWETRFDDDLSIQLTEFHRLEKVASPKCKIQIISDNISYSSTVGSSSSTSGLVFFKNRFPV